MVVAKNPAWTHKLNEVVDLQQAPSLPRPK